MKRIKITQFTNQVSSICWQNNYWDTFIAKYLHLSKTRWHLVWFGWILN